MKNLYAVYNDCLNEIKTCGIVPGNIVDVTINTRAKRRWGRCTVENGFYKIEISDRLLQDDVDIKATKNTMAHEILHTVKGCMNHGLNWQSVANKVNMAYPDIYNIKRTTSSEEKGLEPIGKCRNDTAKYALVCKDCGHRNVYKRAGKAVQNPNRYRCGICGGKLDLLTL